MSENIKDTSFNVETLQKRFEKEGLDWNQVLDELMKNKWASLKGKAKLFLTYNYSLEESCLKSVFKSNKVLEVLKELHEERRKKEDDLAKSLNKKEMPAIDKVVKYFKALDDDHKEKILSICSEILFRHKQDSDFNLFDMEFQRCRDQVSFLERNCILYFGYPYENNHRACEYVQVAIPCVERLKEFVDKVKYGDDSEEKSKVQSPIGYEITMDEVGKKYSLLINDKIFTQHNKSAMSYYVYKYLIENKGIKILWQDLRNFIVSELPRCASSYPKDFHTILIKAGFKDKKELKHALFDIDATNTICLRQYVTDEDLRRNKCHPIKNIDGQIISPQEIKI